MTKTFLGTGWSFPVRTDDRSAVATATGEADVEQSIRILLGTAKGERVMRPEFGCDIHNYAFAVVDTTTRTLISASVEKALARWEPRIEVERVETSAADLDAGRLLVSIDYRIRSSNARRNLVYPFYVEG
ncbi:GPW/gp25 family protein [Halogeometricum sp. S1BR25-6]|uniref:GPW/gp25 family protein n=1 Tax=Halogeometricum salsisoli TaxID=2950536 RepID=A0ABU2GJX5_9EURY|nr:GPW/gp25 family protein [Halogeometricum sp. S1BR25-6]MDS0301121.1 GPW/gp25 family protein [Halogeometricum sp. S1BR25-6]